MNLVSNRNRRGFQLANRGRDPSIGQVVTRVVIKPDDQYSGMMTRGSDDEVVEVFEVFGILGHPGGQTYFEVI
jgi:hypothetical protein